VVNVGSLSVLALEISVKRYERQNERNRRHEVEFSEMVVHLEETFANANNESHNRKPNEKVPQQADDEPHSRMDGETGPLPFDKLLRPHEFHTANGLRHDDAEDGGGEGCGHHNGGFVQEPHRFVHHLAAMVKRADEEEERVEQTT